MDKRYAYVTDVKEGKGSPKVDMYCLNNGKVINVKIQKKPFESYPLRVGDIIYGKAFEEKYAWKFMGKDANGKNQFEKDESRKEWWMTDWYILNYDEFDQIVEKAKV